MSTKTWEWWTVAAGFVGVLLAALAVGNLFNPEDTGPLYGKVIAAVIGVAACATILSGLVVRRAKPSTGGYLIGFGILPASLLVVFFWFPPIGLMGVLAIVVSVRAIIDGGRHASPDPVDAAAG